MAGTGDAMADETLINVTTAGDQDQPGVAGFRGTQFVVVWLDRDSQNIRGRFIGTNGAAAGGEFAINFPGTVGTKRALPTVIETSQGFAVTWIEQVPGGTQQLKLRVFDQDTISGPESQISSAEVEPLIRPAMSRLADGGFVIAWADKRQAERIRGQRFAADGTKSGTDFRANTAPGLHRYALVAGLTNGNFVVAWRARLPGPLLVHFQIFNAKGPVGTEVTTALDVTEIVMAPLDTGRFVIAHIRSALDGEAGFDTTIAQASLFEATGAATSLKFPATTGTKIQSSWPNLAPLSGGRFLLAWTQTNTATPTAGTNVMARMFSSTGALGKVVQVNTLTGGTRFSLSIATTSGPAGDVAFFTWGDDSKAGADKTGRAIEGRAMSIPAGGF